MITIIMYPKVPNDFEKMAVTLRDLCPKGHLPVESDLSAGDNIFRGIGANIVSAERRFRG